MADCTFILDPESGVWLRPGYVPPHVFTDGLKVEQELRNVIGAAQDRSSTSAELNSAIHDWPTFYHLSSRRANLLRPFESRLNGRILEVGCGCGVITRYLAECGASIEALEPALARAEIAATRCRDLPNVRVLAAALEDYEVQVPFDIVTCIGMLEYAPLYSPAADAIGASLERIARMVSDRGVLIIAIENQLGLKYFAGAPEDHVGTPYYGVQQLYRRREPLTLGRREWVQKLARAGFQTIEFLFPFPDYKTPTVILSAAALEDGRIDQAAIIRSAGFTPYRDSALAFSENAAWRSVAANGLVADLANSFLIVAAKAPHAQPLVPGLVHMYSIARNAGFAKRTIIHERDGRLIVSRSQLPTHSSTVATYEHVLGEEPYLEGDIYDSALSDILNRPGWTLAELTDWAKPWLEFLRAQSFFETDTEPKLPASYVDCTPFNMVVGHDGALKPFDLEYIASEPPNLNLIAFRGLWSSLYRFGPCSAPAVETPRNLLELVRSVLVRSGVTSPEGDLVPLIEAEVQLQHEIAGMPIDDMIALIQTAELVIRPVLRPVEVRPASYRAQVYWRDAHQQYSEERSAHVEAIVTEAPSTVRLRIPEHTGAVALRFDPSNLPGVLAAFRLELYSNSGERIWSLADSEDVTDHAPFREMVLLPLGPGGSGSHAAAISGSDPSFELRLDPEQSAALDDGGDVVYEYRWALSPESLLEVGTKASGSLARHQISALGQQVVRMQSELTAAHDKIQEIVNSRTWRTLNRIHRILGGAAES